MLNLDSISYNNVIFRSENIRMSKFLLVFFVVLSSSVLSLTPW